MIRKRTGESVVRIAVLRNFFHFFMFYPKMVRMYKHPEKYSEKEKYEYNHHVFDVFLKACRCEVSVIGAENIPSDTNCFICANHQGKFDPLVIWKTFDRPLSVVVDQAAINRPVIRELCGIYKSYLFDRTNTRVTLKQSKLLIEGLKSGESCMVFPEGKYEEDCDVLTKFKPGCFRAPYKAKTDIVPTVIRGIWRVFENGEKKPYQITVHYLKPMKFDEYKEMTTAEIAAEVQLRIQSVIDELGC